jgi:hypothetical protein
MSTVDRFREARNYRDLNVLMLEVLNGTIPSPIYDFEDVEDENKWHNEGDERFQYLLEINARGYITLNVQECGLSTEEVLRSKEEFRNKSIVGYNCRTSLTLS